MIINYSVHSTLKYPRLCFKFKIGDHVCISKVRGVFTKGYEPNWSEEVFTIVQQKKVQPPMYKLKDYNNEII